MSISSPATAKSQSSKEYSLPVYRFSGEWRDYQKRVLGEISHHLGDKKLNIIAAPGAGKTILGLEVIQHLGNPALILSPTIAIRNQWLDRLDQLFVPEDGLWPEGQSTSLKSPGWITSSTYQSLHMAFSKSGDLPPDPDDDIEEFEEQIPEIEKAADRESFISALVEGGISTIVLDEAHHLRKAWWESLADLLQNLESRIPEVHILSLTATPPYDVEAIEWERYSDMCGPIDVEISIPELVKQGDLCPHQDFIHLSIAEGQELDAIETFSEEVTLLIQHWLRNEDMKTFIRDHAWMQQPENHEGEILSEPALHGSMLIAAREIGFSPRSTTFSILGVKAGKLPPATPKWITPLFQALVDEEEFFKSEKICSALAKDLRSCGALSRGKVRLDKSDRLAKFLVGGSAKINSILAIAELEASVLQDKLRLVILTDYVRAEALANPDVKSTDRMGAGPILRKIINSNMTGLLRPAMITGNLIVIPDQVAISVYELVAKFGIDKDAVSVRPLPKLQGWSRLQIGGHGKSRILAIVTKLFETGELRCLVGTTALLGEGWDAPSINSLVLASSVKTFMLSNQMRGRAIRMNPKVKDKTATIWHLATILPPSSKLVEQNKSLWEWATINSDQSPKGSFHLDPSRLGRDAYTVFRRFGNFAGVPNQEPFIVQSGIHRLDIEPNIWSEDVVRKQNAKMLERAANRERISLAWKLAVGEKNKGDRPVTGTICEPPFGARKYLWRSSAFALLSGFLSGCLWVLYFGARLADGRIPSEGLLKMIATGLAILTLYHWRDIWRLIRAGSPTGYLRQIGECVLAGLREADALDVPRGVPTVKTRAAQEMGFGQGFQIVQLVGATQLDEVTFTQAVEEILGPISTPKHILIRRTRIPVVGQIDYYSVPRVISSDKNALDVLKKTWERRIGPCKILGTRSKEGRKALLRARANAYSTGFVRKSERLTLWE